MELNCGFRPDGFAVEVNQFQQLLADNMRQVATDRAILLPMYTVDNRVNKLVHIRRLTPYLAQHRVRFKGDSPGARLLVQQMRDFPHGDHDDGPDALEMAVRLAADMLNSVPDDGDIFERIIA